MFNDDIRRISLKTALRPVYHHQTITVIHSSIPGRSCFFIRQAGVILAGRRSVILVIASTTSEI